MVMLLTTVFTPLMSAASLVTSDFSASHQGERMDCFHHSCIFPFLRCWFYPEPHSMPAVRRERRAGSRTVRIRSAAKESLRSLPSLFAGLFHVLAEAEVKRGSTETPQPGALEEISLVRSRFSLPSFCRRSVRCRPPRRRGYGGQRRPDGSEAHRAYRASVEPCRY
jgi:hypothetical protein